MNRRKNLSSTVICKFLFRQFLIRHLLISKCTVLLSNAEPSCYQTPMDNHERKAERMTSTTIAMVIIGVPIVTVLFWMTLLMVGIHIGFLTILIWVTILAILTVVASSASKGGSSSGTKQMKISSLQGAAMLLGGGVIVILIGAAISTERITLPKWLQPSKYALIVAHRIGSTH